MNKLSKSLTLRIVLALMSLSPLQGQWAHILPANANSATANPAPAADPAPAANPAPAAQAPDEATKKITDLVHAGKYAEAQELTEGLLIVYPDDQRLSKAKALIDKLLVSAGSTSATPANSQPATPAANVTAEQLTGMDKVDYNTLILLARQAQADADLGEQKKLLWQFMEQSGTFLQKHPEQLLVWELRAQSAVSLNDPLDGCEAGQQLLAEGAADSTDPKVQQLMAQLNKIGWLDKQKADDYKRFGWLLGTWSASWSSDGRTKSFSGHTSSRALQGDLANEVFTKSGSVIEGYNVRDNDDRSTQPDMRGTILESGEIRWKRYYASTDNSSSRKNSRGAQLVLASYEKRIQVSRGPREFYPQGWQPVFSCQIDEDKSTMTMVVPSQSTNPRHNPADSAMTIKYTRLDSAARVDVPKDLGNTAPEPRPRAH